MAWLPRAQWIRRRYGHYRGRARTFRRSFYQRPWFNRRRYQRSRRRRRPLPYRRPRVSRWMVVRQHNPRTAVRCTIGGWMPGLLCIPADPNFRPMKYFEIATNQYVFRSGGWTVHEFSLMNFYKEHLVFRNTWSRSNCGFDLARYRGTKITLWPTEDTDYIVWWDVDYKDQSEFEKLLEKIHPALMLGRPHSRVVLSRKTALRYRPKTIFLPPPARFKNEWETQGEWSKRGLGIVAISMIDLTYPWLPPKMEEYEGQNQNPTWKPPWTLWDFAEKGSNKHKQVIPKGQVVNSDKFWFNAKGTTKPYQEKPLLWLDKWPGWSEDTKDRFVPLDVNNITAVAEGPFVKKYPGAECQIIWTYRSRWTWGGDVALTSEQVCSPETLGPNTLRRKRALAAPEDPSGYIYITDIRKDGFIKPDAWKRLTRATSQGAKFINHPREETSEEETYPDPYQASTESSEEEAGPSAKRPRVSRRVQYRSRIEHLERLRYLLKHFLQNKRSFSD
nr:MAG: ORF1 [Giant panda anellovirus]